MRRSAPIAIALLCLPSLGCIAVAAAAAAIGYVQYDKNEAFRDFERDIDSVWNACLKALDNLGYPDPLDKSFTAAEGHMEVGDVDLRVERYPSELIRVRARVGTFDSEANRQRAGRILAEVAKQLGEE